MDLISKASRIHWSVYVVFILKLKPIQGSWELDQEGHSGGWKNSLALRSWDKGGKVAEE